MEQHHPRCQSCGMSLAEKAHHGTNADCTVSDDYCASCFANGAFTENEVTMEAMTERFARSLARQQTIDEDQAQVLAHGTVPTLKRWKHAHK
mgnify:FL=1